MMGFARFTAILFIVLGVALLVLGGMLAFGGILRAPAPAPSAFNLVPDLSGLFVFSGAIAGGAVVFPGLLLAAVGQVLWLMAGMVDKAQTSNEYIAELVDRMGNARR
jgi:hypothetical protein